LHGLQKKLDVIFEEDRRIKNHMKKIIALVAVLVMGAIGMACGDSGVNNAAANANKMAANANAMASNAMQQANNTMQSVNNSVANATKQVGNAVNAMKPAPASNAANANSNMKK
jgi:hypothetical protein